MAAGLTFANFSTHIIYAAPLCPLDIHETPFTQQRTQLNQFTETNKTAKGTLHDAVNRLHQGSLYFQNSTPCYVVHVNVIAVRPQLEDGLLCTDCQGIRNYVINCVFYACVCVRVLTPPAIAGRPSLH
jgi:hypothetical protein